MTRRVPSVRRSMSIGSTNLSFWQQDQNSWQQSQQTNNSIAATTSIINAISTAETNQGKGLASIANATALNRVDTQLSQAIQNILTGNAGQTSSGSSTGSSSTAASSKPAPATGTGTAVVSTSTPLKSLGIPAGGIVTVSAGKNTTTYASTGSDTVGDLMNALNSDLVGNAAVTASISKGGRLVLTSKNTSDTITVGALYAHNIGFSTGNNTFKPTTSTSTTPAASTPPASTSSTTSSSPTSSTKKSYTTPATEMLSSAASLLSASGVAGSLVNMLA